MYTTIKSIMHDLSYLKDDDYHNNYINAEKASFIKKLKDSLEYLEKIDQKRFINCRETNRLDQNLYKQYIDYTDLIQALKDFILNFDNKSIRKTAYNHYQNLKYKVNKKLKYAVFIDDQIKIGDFWWKNIQEFFIKLNELLLDTDEHNFLEPILLNTDEEIEKFKNKSLDIYSDIEIVFLDRDLNQLDYSDNACGEILKTIPPEIITVLFSTLKKGEIINTESTKTIQMYYRERFGKTQETHPLIYISKNELNNEESINSIFSLITDPKNKRFKFIIHNNGKVQMCNIFDNEVLGVLDLSKYIRSDWRVNNNVPFISTKKESAKETLQISFNELFLRALYEASKTQDYNVNFGLLYSIFKFGDSFESTLKKEYYTLITDSNKKFVLNQKLTKNTKGHFIGQIFSSIEGGTNIFTINIGKIEIFIDGEISPNTNTSEQLSDKINKLETKVLDLENELTSIRQILKAKGIYE